MSLRSLAWFTGWTWLLPVTSVLGVWYVQASVPRPYAQPVSSAVSGAEAVALIFPFVALSACWVTSRLRAASWFDRAFARGRWVMTAIAILPVFSAGLLALTIVIISAMVRDDALGWPGIAPIVVGATILMSVCCWGHALGRLLPVKIAAPLTILSTFAVLGFPPAMNPVWLRHLFGISALCCSVDASPNPRVVASASLVAVASTVSALLIARIRDSRLSTVSRWSRAGAASAVYASAMMVAIGLVISLPAAPTTPRPQSDLGCQTRGASRVCTWPEHSNAVPSYAAELDAVRSIQVRYGLPSPNVFTEAPVSDWARATPIFFQPSLEPTDRAVAAADAIAAQPSACLSESSDDREPPEKVTDFERLGDDSFSVGVLLRQWWRERVGTQLRRTLPPPPGWDIDPWAQAAMARLNKMTPRQQGEYVSAVTTSRQECGPNFMPHDRAS